MGLRDFYNRMMGRKEEELTDYQKRRIAVARANADIYGETFHIKNGEIIYVKQKEIDKRELGKITDEVKLNEALSRISLKRIRTVPGTRVHDDKAYPALIAAYDYIEKNLDGDKRAKYEAAIVKRARRLQEVYWKNADGYRGEQGDVWDPRFLEIKQALEIQRMIDSIKDKGSPRNKSSLEDVASSTAMIIGIVGGLFFLSSNITGNVIGNNQTISNWTGTLLIIIGLIGAFLYFHKSKPIKKSRKKK